MLSSEFSYSYPAGGTWQRVWPVHGPHLRHGCCSPMLASALGYLFTVTQNVLDLHGYSPLVPFSTLEPSYSLLDGFGQSFCLSSDGQSPWSPPGVVYCFLFTMAFSVIVSVCVAWSGGRAVIQNWSAWLHIGLEDRNFLLPRIPRPALLTINPALPALLHFWTPPNSPWFDSWHLMIS